MREALLAAWRPARGTLAKDGLRGPACRSSRWSGLRAWGGFRPGRRRRAQRGFWPAARRPCPQPPLPVRPGPWRPARARARGRLPGRQRAVVVPAQGRCPGPALSGALLQGRLGGKGALLPPVPSPTPSSGKRGGTRARGARPGLSWRGQSGSAQLWPLLGPRGLQRPRAARPGTAECGLPRLGHPAVRQPAASQRPPRRPPQRGTESSGS